MPFRCSRTGMIYPSDYVEEWGKKYGIGLGPVPKSEALINNYDGDICSSPDVNKIMYPLAFAAAQMDWIEAPTAADIAAGKDKPILAIDDQDMSKRATVMVAKQVTASAKLRGLKGL